MSNGRGYDPDRFAKEFEEALPGSAYGAAGRFGQETHESTTTWGNTTNLAFDLSSALWDSGVVQMVSTQLVQVSRRRPTNFTLMTVIQLGQGWTGALQPYVFVVMANVGVGQAIARIQRTFAVPAASLINGAQVVLDLFSPIPAHSLATQVSLFGSNALTPGLPPNRDAQVTQLAAPLVQ